MTDSKNRFLEALDELRPMLEEAMKRFEDISEDYWNSLDKEQQLKVFCAVVRRIVKGEKEGHSYRGMLYDVFGFDTHSYAVAQVAGFLDIHNMMEYK